VSCRTPTMPSSNQINLATSQTQHGYWVLPRPSQRKQLATRVLPARMVAPTSSASDLQSPPAMSPPARRDCAWSGDPGVNITVGGYGEHAQRDRREPIAGCLEATRPQ
jgi:hypothetical protein